VIRSRRNGTPPACSTIWSRGYGFRRHRSFKCPCLQRPLLLIAMGRRDLQACHVPICGFCGLLVNETDTLSSRVSLTQPGLTINHTKPTFDEINRCVCAGLVISRSGVHDQNSYPCINLMHRSCLELYQKDAPARMYLSATLSLARRGRAQLMHVEVLLSQPARADRQQQQLIKQP